MKKCIPLDLRKYCDNKIIYKRLPQKREREFGLDNMCVLKSAVNLKEQELFNGVKFKFCLGRFDNIVCNRQEIKVNDIASKIHIIAFSYWGDTNEYFKIIYDDLSEEMIKIPFIDWSHEPIKDLRNRKWYGENTSTIKVVTTTGSLTHLLHFHHTKCEIKQRKIIDKIILPDNMFTHIFAITLEK